MVKQYNPVFKLINEKRFSEDIALTCPEYRWFSYRFNRHRYSELINDVESFARYLHSEFNIKEKDTVLVLFPFSYELYITVAALFSLNAHVVFIEPWMDANTFNMLIEHMHIKLGIMPFKARLMLKIRHMLRHIPQTTDYCKKNNAHYDINEFVKSSNIAITTFTTGSSGVPKTVHRTYGMLKEQSSRIMKYLKKTDRDFVTFPNIILMNLERGNETILPPASFKGNNALDKRFLKSLSEYNDLNSIFISVSHLRHMDSGLLLDKCGHIYTGGSIVMPEYLESIGILDKTTVFYGSTEIEPIAVCKPYKDNERGVLCGIPDNEIHVRIRHMDGNIGEIEVQTQDNEFISTGDIGYLTSNNEIVLMGRMIDTVIYRGKYIYPFEIERNAARRGYFRRIVPVVHNNQLLIIFDRHADNQIREIVDSMEMLKKAGIITVNAFPRDKRHSSKIDIEALKKSL